MKYIAQCTSGLQEAAAGLLSKDRALAATVRAQEDGLVVFDATCSRRSLQGVPYLNNVFVVLHEAVVEHDHLDTHKQLESITTPLLSST